MNTEHSTQAVAGRQLVRSLQGRHMTMISIGGAVGAGLFVGSGVGIQQAGPGILISYGLTSVLVVLVMRMLAEMAVARPDSGAFAVYARLAFGRWAGFATGWMYWLGWPLGLAIEGIATGTILHSWLPVIPVWLGGVLLIAVITAVNLTSVRAYGEVEYWAVWLKVAVIVAFIAVGLIAIGGLVPGTQAPGTSNLLGHGGFLPQGIGGVVTASVGAMFAFSGTEIVTIAAGEAADPAKAIRRSTRSILWRICLFYFGSLLVVVLLLPWNSAAVGESPFAATLQHLGLSNASTVLSVVIFAAMISTMNSQVYVSSRIMYSLARDSAAPRILGRISRTGTPRNAILLAVSLAVLLLLLQFFHPSTAFSRLLGVAGATVYLIWLTIVVTQLVLGRRDRLDGRPPAPGTGMWLFPALSWFTLAAMLALLGFMLTLPAVRTDMLGALVLMLLLVAAAVIWARLHPARNEAEAVVAEPDTALA
ncbi:amino acid permease [Streptomyces sp. NPDC088350]|uniref:amino acid permease n=1 Tax=Streptomyces sp. NPDC088350 TaxID=3365854 RepID=UPI0037FC7660